MAITIAGIEAKPIADKPARMSVVLWGPAGSGKTTLASTAPGKKLFLMFDPDGATSIANADDVLVADMGQMSPGQIDGATNENPWNLRQTMEDNKIDTLIVDSLTNFGIKAIARGIIGINKATMVNPSKQGYGARTGYTHQLCLNLLNMTAKLNKHVVFIAHEGSGETNDSGAVISYPIGLGGQLPTMIPNLMSEVWYVNDDGKDRKIMVRPARMRKPMKTRMFTTTGDVEFVWKYDADTRTGDGIATWFDAWVKGGKQKLPLPK
jgi:hypothetical protein